VTQGDILGGLYFLGITALIFWSMTRMPSKVLE
jgi:hypothetical protein